MAAIGQQKKSIQIVFPHGESYWFRVVTREESLSIVQYLLQTCNSERDAIMIALKVLPNGV
jgi:hypothetical protein